MSLDITCLDQYDVVGQKRPSLHISKISNRTCRLEVSSATNDPCGSKIFFYVFFLHSFYPPFNYPIVYHVPGPKMYIRRSHCDARLARLTILHSVIHWSTHYDIIKCRSGVMVSTIAFQAVNPGSIPGCDSLFALLNPQECSIWRCGFDSAVVGFFGRGLN